MAKAMATAYWSTPMGIWQSAVLVLVVAALTVINGGHWILDLIVALVVLALAATTMLLGLPRAMRRQARRLAPPGAVLGVGFGASAVALQTGSERKTAAYTSIKTARVHHDFMVLTIGNRYALTALPAHLFPATFPDDVARFHRGS